MRTIKFDTKTFIPIKLGADIWRDKREGLMYYGYSAAVYTEKSM